MFKFFIKLVFNIYYRLLYRVKVTDISKIKGIKSAIIFSNHCDFQDPLLIGTFSSEYIRFMAKKELFKSKIGSWFFTSVGSFPIDRGNSDLSAIRNSLRFLKNGEKVLIFPEGTRNSTKTPLRAKSGAVMIALKAKVPILPVTVKGKFKLFGKLEIIYHDPVYLDEYYGKKLSNDEYVEIGQKILDKIYKEL